MIKKVSLLLLVFGLFLLAGSSPVQAAPAKGVHILFSDELAQAARVVGEGGYVVVPITPLAWQRLDKWQQFMREAKKMKVIPILRLTTFPQSDGSWQRPTLISAVDWPNFLSLLDWPSKEKLVIIFNEPNHAQEWGGQISPQGYARVLREYSVKFHTKDINFRVLPAAMDMAAARTKDTWPAYQYWQEVWRQLPDFYQLVDGWNSHAYPNPAFSAKPRVGVNNVVSYHFELRWFEKFYHQKWDKPLFITETGWNQNRLHQNTLCSYLTKSWQMWSADKNLRVVSWFLLNGSPGPFASFSLEGSSHTQVLNCWQHLGS